MDIGAGAATIDSPQAGEDLRIRPIPVLSYEVEVFLSWPDRPLPFDNTRTFLFISSAPPALDGIDIEDPRESTNWHARGINRHLLEDRGDQLDAECRSSGGKAAAFHGEEPDVTQRHLQRLIDTLR